MMWPICNSVMWPICNSVMWPICNSVMLSICNSVMWPICNSVMCILVLFGLYVRMRCGPYVIVWCGPYVVPTIDPVYFHSQKVCSQWRYLIVFHFSNAQFCILALETYKQNRFKNNGDWIASVIHPSSLTRAHIINSAGARHLIFLRIT